MSFARKHYPSTANQLAITMKVLSVALSMLFAGLIKTAAGIQCDSFCAACWKIGSPGVDIKMSCDGFWNCYPCPGGYNNIHCAKADRCICKEPNCKDFGPCYCGIDYHEDGVKACKVPYPGQECTS